MKCFPFLVVHTTHLPVDKLLVFNNTEAMFSMDVIHQISWPIVKFFDGTRLDLDVHIEEPMMMVEVVTLVNVFHCLS